jgi:hypothetical protein
MMPFCYVGDFKNLPRRFTPALSRSQPSSSFLTLNRRGSWASTFLSPEEGTAGDSGEVAALYVPSRTLLIFS